MSVVTLAWAMASCGSPTDDGPPPVAKVTVTAPVTNIVIGKTTQLAVKLEDRDGNLLTNRSVAWRSSNDTYARVSPSGLVSGEAAGEVTITATSEGQSGSAAMTIRVDPCAEALPITVGQPVAGRLLPSDCALDDQTLADRYALTLDVATPLQIDLASVDFDAFLIVTTRTGSIIALNDDGAGLLNARIDTTLAAGRYIIWANTAVPEETGDYTLSIGSTAVTQCATVGQIAIGQSVTGDLATTDCLLGDGTYADGWQFTLDDLTGVVADLRSTAVDAFVLITDAQGNRLGYNDDGGLGTNSLLELSLEPGTYHVWANTFYSGQTGAYTLTLGSDACNTLAVLPFAQTRSGELKIDDCELSDGSFSDRWLLTLGAPTTVRIDLVSAAFDPYLVVTNDSGDIVATDDDGGDGDDARIEATLPAGSYIVWANTYAAGETGAYSLSTVAAESAALNLRIDGLYVTQATQRFAGTVPLVKDRGAYLRVFGRANLANTAAPPVRVRLYHGGVLKRTLTIPAASAVPTVLSEETEALSWNVSLEEADVQPGLAIDAEIDPNGSVSESDEADNRYPPSGEPKAFDVREVPPFNVTFVPVNQSVSGLVGSVTENNVESFVSLAREIYPLRSVDVAVRAPYTTTLPALHPSDQNQSWSRLLGEISALRIADNSERYYYGVVKIGYTQGIGGMGLLGRPAAIGYDGSGRRHVTAHEFGHNFGRLHAPCGGPAGVDPDYPYDEGAIGVVGYVPSASAIVPRTRPDLMSYCGDPWISDYTYEAVLAFRQPTAAQLTASTPTAVLLVWGTVEEGRVTLEPAFEIVARPSVPNKRGPWSLVARDADGAVVFSHAFDVDEVADARRPSATFALALPIDSQAVSRVNSLRVTGPAGQAERGRARVAPPAVSRERAPDRVTMRWDRDVFPAALLRDTRTGRILSIVRNGELSVRPEPGLEVLLSDGVRTVRERVEEP